MDKWSIKIEALSGKQERVHMVQKPREQDFNCHCPRKEFVTYLNEHTQDLKGREFKKSCKEKDAQYDIVLNKNQ